MGKLAAIIATAAAATALSALTALPAQAEPVVQYQLAGSTRCLTDIGTNIVLRTCSETSLAQQWIVPISGGVDQPHNRATGKCLGAVGSDVIGQTCGAGPNQRWRRETSTGVGDFKLHNVGTGKCLTSQVTLGPCATSGARWAGLR